MKKVYLLLMSVAAAMLWPSESLAQAPGFSIQAPTVKGATGSEVKVPLTVSGASGVGALHVEVTYDPTVLEPQAVERGKLTPANTLIDSKATSGRYVIGLVSADKIEGSGEVVLVKFKVLGKKGAKSDIGLDQLRAWEGDLNRFELKVTAAPGQFTVASKSSFPWWIVIVAAAVIAAYLLYRRFRSGAKPAKPVAPVAPAAPTGRYVYVDAPEALVGSDGQVVTTLMPGKWYRSAEISGDWIQVTDDEGHTGWINRDHVRFE
jgi:hypothetical protein